MAIKHRVGAVADIPANQGLRVEIGDRAIAVFVQDGTLFAVGDSCPHMGASLSEGYLDGKAVVCPWHGWVFNLQDGTSPFDEEAMVPVYRVTVENGDIFVEVDESAAPGPCSADLHREET